MAVQGQERRLGCRTTLSCKHTVIYPEIPPHIGDLVYCHDCGDYSTVDDYTMIRKTVVSIASEDVPG